MFRTSTAAAIVATAMLATPFAVSAMATLKADGRSRESVATFVTSPAAEADGACRARKVRVVYAGYGEAGCATR